VIPDTVAPLACTISRFGALMRTTVSEESHITWPEALKWLAGTPDSAHEGSNDSGWSPVRYQPNKRSKENVREVFGLVLDFDKDGDWARVSSAWADHYGLIYTTKSHGIKGDRFRLVLPLSRPITADEYPRVWEWAARRSPCKPDGQCKDASRFWYDPTIPPGGWRAEMLEGTPINVDRVLAEPAAPGPLRSLPPVIHADTKARRAVSYVQKMPGAVAGQAGHTATFNAVCHVLVGFDLDADQARTIILDHYNPRCDPPWKEREIDHKIRQAAEKCTRPRGYLLGDREPIRTAAQASDAVPTEDKQSVDWWSLLKFKSGKSENPRRGYHNVLTFIRHHPSLVGKWSLNTMTGDVWFDGRPSSEAHFSEVRAHADVCLGFSPGRDEIESAIQTVAADRPFHPIQAYLKSIQWDGTPRLANVAREYLGSDSALDAELVRKWMISAAARALNPGCKVDTSLMIYGEQGWFKSSFFKVLGGEWHADSPIDIQSKDSFAQIHAAWIYEFAELENVVHGRAESRLKAWLTSTHDMYRAPYARVVTSRPRSCVICGTTNRKQFLTDETGSRRFWIVEARGPIPAADLASVRDQLWAESVVAYEAGESWWLDRSAERERTAASIEYWDQDAWHDVIADWVDGRPHVTIGDVLKCAVGVDVARQTGIEQKRAQRVLVDLGWRRCRRAGRWVYAAPGRAHLASVPPTGSTTGSTAESADDYYVSADPNT
jgi:hypothetical protein